MSIQRNVFWFSFGHITYLGTQWIITILVTRKSGLIDAGILSLATSVSATFRTIAFFGIRNYQVSDIKGKYSYLIYFQSRFITCFVALFVCIIFIMFNSYRANQSIAILCFMFFRIIEAFSDVFHGELQKMDRLDLVGKGFLYRGIAIILFFSIGYYTFNSLNIGLFFMALGSFFVTRFYDMKNAKQFFCFAIEFRFGRAHYNLLKETAPLCVCICLQSAISTTPKYILENMCNEVALGAYSSIFAPVMLIQVAATYIFTPFVGKFSELYQNKKVDKFKKLFLEISLCIILMGIIAVPCVKSVGWSLLNIVFGHLISDYEYLLIPILFCAFANAIFAFCSMLSVVVRDFLGQTISCLLGFALCIISTIVCVSKFGINGASYGLLIGSLFAVSFMIARITHIISGLGYANDKS